MRSRPSALRDFTVDRRTWMLLAVSVSSASVRLAWLCCCCAQSH